MKVDNTTSAMDFAALGHPPSKKFQHLLNQTVGEAFVENVVTKIVKLLEQSVNISKLNEAVANMAIKGKNSVQKQNNLHCVKKGCSKEIRKEISSDVLFVLV